MSTELQDLGPIVEGNPATAASTSSSQGADPVETREQDDLEDAGGETQPMVVAAAHSERFWSWRNWTKRQMYIIIAVLSILLILAILVLVVLLIYQSSVTLPHTLPDRFYDANYLRYLAFFSPKKRSKEKHGHVLSKEQVLFQTQACGIQHIKRLSDPYYFSSLMGIPMLPSSSGFMSTHSSIRFLSVFEQVAVNIGERKHGMWRYQENRFIRLYREKGSKGGITVEEKRAAIDMGGCTGEAKTDEQRRLLRIIRKYYLQLKIGKFKYAFGEEVQEDTQWLNWIDIPMYHPFFEKKYENHVPVDLSIYYCQQSSPAFPHVGATWDLITSQPAANKVGPLGKRAGLDVKENYNNVIRWNLFPDTSLWANIGQGNPATDEMLKTRAEMKNRSQTINHARVDLTKVEMEVYMYERIYHNQTDPYLFLAVIISEKSHEAVHSYVRPDGNYYNCLVKKGHTIINTSPNFNPTIAIANETDRKKIYGLPNWSTAYNYTSGQKIITGGGCPTKGGDTGIYPWGSTGAAWPIGVNYEETTPLCDTIKIDIKFWANLDGEDSWTDPAMYIGNSGLPHQGKETLMYFAQANLYGKFRDPYNVEKGQKNPHELDFTEDHKIRYSPKGSNVTCWDIDFGKYGTLNEVNIIKPNVTPKGCLADEAKDSDYCGPRGLLLP